MNLIKLNILLFLLASYSSASSIDSDMKEVKGISEPHCNKEELTPTSEINKQKSLHRAPAPITGGLSDSELDDILNEVFTGTPATPAQAAALDQTESHENSIPKRFLKLPPELEKPTEIQSIFDEYNLLVKNASRTKSEFCTLKTKMIKDKALISDQESSVKKLEAEIKILRDLTTKNNDNSHAAQRSFMEIAHRFVNIGPRLSELAHTNGLHSDCNLMLGMLNRQPTEEDSATIDTLLAELGAVACDTDILVFIADMRTVMVQIFDTIEKERSYKKQLSKKITEHAQKAAQYTAAYKIYDPQYDIEQAQLDSLYDQIIAADAKIETCLKGMAEECS